MRTHHRKVVVVSILGLLLGGPGIVAEDPAPPLFELGSEVTEYSTAAAVGEYEISPDLARLRSAPGVLTLELPGLGFRRARLAELESRGGGDLTWNGRLDPEAGRSAGKPGRNVVLTLENGVLSGIVFTGERAFQIVPRAGRSHRLVLVNPDLFPDCDGGITPSAFDAIRPRTGAVRPKVSASALPVIDVLAVYTPAALTAAGGVDEIEATIRSAVDVTNAAYRNSEVASTLTLIHTEKIEHTESAAIEADLDWVAADPAVAALRDAHHADVVSLIVNGGPSCGIAYVQTDPGPAFESAAFQVTRLDCAFADLTFAHEVAHLLGAEHNPEDSMRWPSSGSFPWSFGHYHHGGYRTVMSISASCAAPCPRQPYFSNPDIDLSGLPTGVAGERENFRTLNDTATIVAGFRTRPPPIFADAFETGDLSAWDLVCNSAECEL